MKLFKSIKNWYQTRAYARTVVGFGSFFIVLGVFISMISLGVFDGQKIKAPPAEYLSLNSSMKPEELEQRLKTHASEIQELVFFEGTKFVAVLGADFEGEKLVAPVDVEEIQRLASVSKIKTRSEKSVLTALHDSGPNIMLIVAFCALMLFWLGWLLLKKPDPDTKSRLGRMTEALSQAHANLLTRYKLRKSRLHLSVTAVLILALIAVAGARFYFNTPTLEVPPEYKSVKQATAWQVARHLSNSPGQFERAVVIDDTNTLFVVVKPSIRPVSAAQEKAAQSVERATPTHWRGPAPAYVPSPDPQVEAAGSDACATSPETCAYSVSTTTVPEVNTAARAATPQSRYVVFPKTAAGNESLSKLIAQINQASVPLKHVAATPDTSYWKNMPGSWATAILLLAVLAIGWVIYCIQGLSEWMDAEDGKPGKKRAIAVGGSSGRAGSAHIVIPDEERKVLADVAGCDEAIDKFRLVAAWIQDAVVYQHFGAKLPNGILLSGPPGTGKTLLARALAGEVDGNYFYKAGSDFVNKYVGVGADNVRALFDQAKAAFKKTGKPSIVFIDEIDAVGKQRSADGSGGEGERDQTVNQLLTCIQGFDPNNGTLVIAATNRPETLDSGLTRSGRFDYKVEVGRPDRKGRRAIYGVYLRNRQLEEGVEIEELCDDLAKRSHDFVGADIELVVNEAATRAAKRNAPSFAGKTPEEIALLPRIITRADLHSGIDQVMYGELIKSKVRSAEERKATAIHEIGHACIPTVENGDPVSRITIVMTTKSLGLMESHPEEDRYGWSKEQFILRIKTMLAGRVAEDKIGKSVSTGASNDFERASQLARCMAAIYGMTDELGVISIPVDKNGFPVGNIGQDLMAEFNKTWRKIIADCYTDTVRIIEENREKIVRAADVLFEEETLTGDYFREIWNKA